MKEKQKDPNEVFEYELINSFAALPHFYCSYSLSGSASCFPLQPPPSASWRIAFFFQTDQRVVTPQTFFFSHPAGLKKKKKLLDCLCLTASLIPTKEEEEEKEEISSSVGSTDLQQVNDPLVKITAVEGRTTVAGSAENCGVTDEPTVATVTTRRGRQLLASRWWLLLTQGGENKVELCVYVVYAKRWRVGWGGNKKKISLGGGWKESEKNQHSIFMHFPRLLGYSLVSFP